MEERFLNRLAREFPSLQKAAAEVVNLNAILALPKGTEYFFSDLHGEYDAFAHLLNSASGMIRDKIDMLFENTLQERDRRELANLIYYPERHLKQVHESDVDFSEWVRVKVYQLLEVIRLTAEKYTRSKVRKKAPADFAYILDELLHFEPNDRTRYYGRILQSVLENDMGDALVIGMCEMIQNLSIDMLHIIGDIFDRGPHADRIMDRLMEFPEVDIQWGNHDICWMGAACGNLTCIAAVLCSALRYNSFDMLEDGYGINLRALNVFASEVYGNDPCTRFSPHLLDQNVYDPVDAPLAAKMHKAMAVIQCKLEGQLYHRHPEYGMEARCLFETVNFADGTVTIDGETHELLDKNFPTVDPNDPLALSEDERELMDTIASSFRHSERLQKHIRFLYAKGSMFKCINGNLLFHGCIPMTEDGEFDEIQMDGVGYSGRRLLEKIDQMVKTAVFSSHHYTVDCAERDFLWYLWCGPKSPLFGKSKMATFEGYFIGKPELMREEMNPYYRHVENRTVCEYILREFGMDPAASHVINGHVPVKIGENPVKAEGKLYVIDGGISKAYRSKTGIGGYTLIYNSRYLALAEHKPFVDVHTDTSPKVNIVERMQHRVLVSDTDSGRGIAEDVQALQELIKRYRSGAIRERI